MTDLGGGWQLVEDPESGHPYYWNANTGASSWEEPIEVAEAAAAAAQQAEPAAEPAAAPAAASGGPTDWVELKDPASGRSYWWSESTGDSTWNRPAGFSGGARASTAGTAAVNTPAGFPKGKVDKDKKVRKWGEVKTVGLQRGKATNVSKKPVTAMSTAPAVSYLSRPHGTGSHKRMSTNNAWRYDGPWEEYTDDASGRKYYSNKDTGDVTWDRPAEMDAKPAPEAAKPKAPAAAPKPVVAKPKPKATRWKQLMDDEGRFYYWHMDEERAQWEKPPEGFIPHVEEDRTPKAPVFGGGGGSRPVDLERKVEAQPQQLDFRSMLKKGKGTVDPTASFDAARKTAGSAAPAAPTLQPRRKSSPKKKDGPAAIPKLGAKSAGAGAKKPAAPAPVALGTGAKPSLPANGGAPARIGPGANAPAAGMPAPPPIAQAIDAPPPPAAPAPVKVAPPAAPPAAAAAPKPQPPIPGAGPSMLAPEAVLAQRPVSGVTSSELLALKKMLAESQKAVLELSQAKAKAEEMAKTVVAENKQQAAAAKAAAEEKQRVAEELEKYKAETVALRGTIEAVETEVKELRAHGVNDDAIAEMEAKLQKLEAEKAQLESQLAKSKNTGESDKIRGKIDQLAKQNEEVTGHLETLHETNVAKKRRKVKSDWREVLDPASGKPYYYHKKTKVTTWKIPEELVKARELAERGEGSGSEIDEEVDEIYLVPTEGGASRGSRKSRGSKSGSRGSRRHSRKGSKSSKGATDGGEDTVAAAAMAAGARPPPIAVAPHNAKRPNSPPPAKPFQPPLQRIEAAKPAGPPPSKSGQLDVRVDRNRWNKRWVVLSGTNVHVYRSEGGRQDGKYSIEKARFLWADSRESGKPFAIEMRMTHNKVFFTAKDDADLTSWLETMRNAKKYHT